MSESYEELAIPDLKWLGVHHADFSNHQNGVLSLSEADNGKLNSLLSRLALPRCRERNAWLHELTLMKSHQRKAEIEILHDCEEGLEAYVMAKVQQGRWI